MFIRTKRKGSEFQGDLHHFDNKWTEVPDGEVRAFYLDNDNLEVVEKKPAKPAKPTKESKKPAKETVATVETEATGEAET